MSRIYPRLKWLIYCLVGFLWSVTCHVLAKDREMFRSATPCGDVQGYAVAQSIGLNSLPQLQSQDQLYAAPFEPGQSALWQGNLKRYAVDFKSGAILDKDGKRATRFKAYVGEVVHSSAHSFWPEPESARSGGPDGDAVLQGGARELWEQHVQKMQRPHLFVERMSANPGAKPQLLRLPAQEKSAIAKRGWGAALHSQPLLVNFKRPQQGFAAQGALFIGTSTGWLHALSAQSGKPIFSFLPALMRRQAFGSADESARESVYEPTQSLLYGLDAPWLAWRLDNNNDGVIEASAGDQVMVYGGMRRGGHAYYALDVTVAGPADRMRPKPDLRFNIQGGATAEASSPFRFLGQTWSVPVLQSIRFQQGAQPVTRPVIIFAGGYDPEVYDQWPWQFSQTRQTWGGGIYILDAQTGDLLWWAAQQGGIVRHAALQHSIVTSIKPIDLNNDGLLDRFYIVDIAGQVFRVTLDNGNATMAKPLSKIGEVALIADLGSASQARPRYFFTTPTVGVVRKTTSESVVALAVGSGVQHDWQDTELPEAMFVIFDDIMLPKKKAAVIKATDLPVLNLKKQKGVVLSAQARGWRMRLGGHREAAGEKVLQSPLLFKNILWFTTFIPKLEQSTGCSGDVQQRGSRRHWGKSRLYAVSILNGASPDIFNQSVNVGDIYGAGRYREKDTGAAGADKVQVIISEDDQAILNIGSDRLVFGEDLKISAKPEIKTMGWRRHRLE